MKQLTEREKEVLSFIKSYRNENQFSPSLRDICRGCYLGSTNSAAYYVDQLVRKGAIHYVPRQARSITITFEEVG